MNFSNPIENDTETDGVKGNSSVKEEKLQVVRDDEFNDENSEDKNTSSSKSVRSLVKEADDFIQKQADVNYSNENILPPTSSGRKRCKPNHLRY